MSKYETVEGRSPGQPEILISESTLDVLGMPYIDHDSIEQFFVDDVGMPIGTKSVIKLQGKHGDVGTRILGTTSAFKSRISVNAVASEAAFVSTGGTMRVLAHEARHRADHLHPLHKLLNVGRLTSIIGAATLVANGLVNLGDPKATLASLSVTASMYVAGLGEKSLSSEIWEPRAYAQEEQYSTLAHQADILFPAETSERTQKLMQSGALTLEMIRHISSDESDLQFASNYLILPGSSQWE